MIFPAEKYDGAADPRDNRIAMRYETLAEFADTLSTCAKRKKKLV